MVNESGIDEIDRELIAFLFEDGREKFTELGLKLKSIKDNKMSHVAVQKRLQKMIESQVIKIQANTNINHDESISAFVLIETRDYSAQRRIIERYRLCPRVVFMDLVSGKYNLILRAMAPKLKEMECFLNYSWLKNEEGIRNLEIYISTTNVKPKFVPMPAISKEQKLKRAPCGSRCDLCHLRKIGDCVGCPATIFPELPVEEDIN